MEYDQKNLDNLTVKMAEIKELTDVDPVKLLQLIYLWLEEKRSP
jgi:hypothetical protein